ncbi:MAG: hypothetical protein C0504_02550 [Candidatus Solibacter sp.]|nr:hypothetical protein [Candidatus Solibacter sp.]
MPGFLFLLLAQAAASRGQSLGDAIEAVLAGNPSRRAAFSVISNRQTAPPSEVRGAVDTIA